MFGGGEEEEEIDTTDNDVNDSGEGFLTSSMKSVSYLSVCLSLLLFYVLLNYID